MPEEVVITLHKTDKKKIYVSPEGFEGFYLYPTEVKKLKLQDGDRYLPDALEEMRREYALPRAKRRAVALLARGDKTEQELREKLLSSLTDSRSLEETMDFVKSSGYVDDLQYARDYIYFKRNKKSFLQIKAELKKKGISSEVLNLVFEEEGGQQKEEIFSQMEKYARKFPELDWNSRQKIYAHFARKGYAGSLIREAMDDLAAGREEP